MGVSKICKVCKKEFVVRKYREKTAVCCSRSCLWYYTFEKREPKRLERTIGKKAHNNAEIKFTCVACGSIFFDSPSRVNRVFCSNKCYSSVFPKIKPIYRKITINGIRYPEHRYMMEQFLERKLNPEEIVHHINHNHRDNRIENLKVMTHKDHSKYHMSKKPSFYKKILK